MTFEEWWAGQVDLSEGDRALATIAYTQGYRAAIQEILDRQMDARPELERAEAARLKNLKSLPGA